MKLKSNIGCDCRGTAPMAAFGHERLAASAKLCIPINVSKGLFSLSFY
ncbi:hypothetical protein [Pseudovibrio sp. Ad26]|nr:hypothetical protein [Pseudovibrio sp. Ad26]